MRPDAKPAVGSGAGPVVRLGAGPGAEPGTGPRPGARPGEGPAVSPDVLVAEIGSTTTVVNAFRLGEHPRFLGQGLAPTTVDRGDVILGLEAALDDLMQKCAPESGGRPEPWDSSLMLAASSAAGGLSMTVHGLVYDMTVRAAKEAALGAGAVIKFITAGDMTEYDLRELRRIDPKIILLAGGVDYGERDTAIRNARRLAQVGLKAPVVYAGNIAARAEVADILGQAGIRFYIVDNVYPKVDELVVEPARRIIQDVFEEHITRAPGMDNLRQMVKGTVLPTPGAVMEACKLLQPVLGDVVCLDVGGATTDVHSVASGSPEIQAILESPEPLAKRTVEGDLGIYRNAANVYSLVKDRAERDLGFDPSPVIEELRPIPETPQEVALVRYLAAQACKTALSRHAGSLKFLYGPSGKQTVASGKDLTSVNTIIGTGGALTRLPGGEGMLKPLVGQGPGRELYPKDARILIDTHYIMAACGVLSRQFPEEAREILVDGLEVRE
ncbi:MAG TPA: DNA mismatch repair protein MutL [Firmicutes bacterium]|nr:DNA mismatch repair protein MutL [Candidatus Fermentithermobacillaceae bacterium]